MTDDPLLRATYVHGHAPAVVRQHGMRTAEEAAAFLLPELSPGMRLLDVGCGPGSITLGLAERLPRGEVVAIDLSREMLAQNRLDAEARGVTNLRYEYGNVYELTYPDASFDVAYAHQVFQHLADRSAALREMLRVVKPGGLIAVRDVDWGSIAYWPQDPWLDRFIEVYEEAARGLGGEPQMGRRMRTLFHEAGLSDVQVTAAVWCYATHEETVTWGDSYADRLLTSWMGERPVEAGLATRAEIEAMAEAFRVWARKPGALWAFTHMAALARKPTP
jgi:ubiquinone/menaquinone biosynthesis C-methylase UbiE